MPPAAGGAGPGRAATRAAAAWRTTHPPPPAAKARQANKQRVAQPIPNQSTPIRQHLHMADGSSFCAAHGSRRPPARTGPHLAHHCADVQVEREVSYVLLPLLRLLALLRRPKGCLGSVGHGEEHQAGHASDLQEKAGAGLGGGGGAAQRRAIPLAHAVAAARAVGSSADGLVAQLLLLLRRPSSTTSSHEWLPAVASNTPQPGCRSCESPANAYGRARGCSVAKKPGHNQKMPAVCESGPSRLL